MSKQSAFLILEDGTLYRGYTIGYLLNSANNDSEALGEIVFNTSMSGYQEIITDPSYKNQIVCFTYPSIGNYGINNNDYESAHPYLSGIVIKDYCEFPSNFNSKMTLADFLKQEKIVGISGVDTRELVFDIRKKGELRAGIFQHPYLHFNSHIEEKDKYFLEWIDHCVAKVCASKTIKGENLTKEFKGEHLKKRIIPNSDKYIKVAVLDFGIKESILSNFYENKIQTQIFPGDTLHYEWKGFDPADYSGYFLSNGPGDPCACTNGIANAQYLLTLGKPIFGVCLGHQIISTALGAKTYKMKFGHHGANQPVRTRKNKNIQITSQNHGFTVDTNELENILNDFQSIHDSEIDIEKNLNDDTVEGFYIKTEKYKILSIQYHPEASPGPQEAKLNFHRFRNMLQT